MAGKGEKHPGRVYASLVESEGDKRFFFQMFIFSPKLSSLSLFREVEKLG